MVDQLNASQAKLRVWLAKSVPKQAGARRNPRVGGTWKILRQRELHGQQPDGQVRNIAEVATAIASGDLSRKITVDVRGEILQLKETLNTMVDQSESLCWRSYPRGREVGY